MNERMLELYRQAQIPHIAIDPSNNMPYETTCFSADKFSELIVQEIANFIDVHEQIDRHGEPYQIVYGSDIRRLFGVK